MHTFYKTQKSGVNMTTKIWLTADSHFGDKNILKYENRPFQDVDFTEHGKTDFMDNEIIRRWNSVVAKDDMVFHLGDVGAHNTEQMKKIINSLNGYKTLIMGNHDKDSSRNTKWWRNVGFDEVSEYPIVIEDYIILRHEPPTYFNDATPFFFIYGHVHSTDLYKTITKSTACVCVERWDYSPVELARIRDLVSIA